MHSAVGSEGARHSIVEVDGKLSTTSTPVEGKWAPPRVRLEMAAADIRVVIVNAHLPEVRLMGI